MQDLRPAQPFFVFTVNSAEEQTDAIERLTELGLGGSTLPVSTDTSEFAVLCVDKSERNAEEVVTSLAREFGQSTVQWTGPLRQVVQIDVATGDRSGDGHWRVVQRHEEDTASNWVFDGANHFTVDWYIQPAEAVVVHTPAETAVA